MSSPGLPEFLSRGRFLSLLTSIGVLLVVAVLLLGWFVGSRSASSATSSATVADSTWAQSPGLLITDVTDVEALRARGWTLPLAEMPGYRIDALREVRVEDEPMVRMTVVDQLGHVIEVVEQRGRIDARHPIDGFTSLPSSTVGLEPTALEASPVLLRPGPTWLAQIVHDDVVYTVRATTSPSRMVRILHHVEASDRGVLQPAPQADSGVAHTILTGWRRILGTGS